MLRTFLFIFVVGFAVSASAKVEVDILESGIPRNLDVNTILENDQFFTQNVIPITGYHSDGTNLQFSFIYKSCGLMIKNSAFTADYFLVGKSTVFVKFQLNADYKDSIIQQAACNSDRSKVSTVNRQMSFFFVRDIQKKFKDIDVSSLEVIVVNHYQNNDEMLDLRTAEAITQFITP